jgi:RecB family exonuclease
VALGAGARALESDLLRFVADDQERVRGTPARMQRPLRVVVPSGALRSHLASALVANAGRALLGVQVQTLAALAREVLERAGVAPEPEDCFAIRVRRCARSEPGLHGALDDLADGYGAVRVGVDDLLDAGFASGHADALDEVLASQGLAPEAAERALLRVAAAVASTLGDDLGSHRSRLFAHARDLLERGAERALPARAVAIYGFSDATGVQTDLLVALVRALGARVWLELPPDPAGSPRFSREPIFGANLRERLRGAAHEEVSLKEVAPAHLELWRARDPYEEARAVAGALRAALDAGAVPERLAVVARDLTPYRLALRQHLTSLAVPFSGISEAGPVSPAGRRLAALLELLRERESVPAERWLEAHAPRAPEVAADLRHALHKLGCATLGDVADMPVTSRGLQLKVPARLGDDGKGRIRSVRRELPAARVASLGASAAALVRKLLAWPESAALSQHARWLDALVREGLGWEDRTPGSMELAARLDPARRPLVLDRLEFLDWLARALVEEERVALGGAGGGVQVLSVMEARGLVFDHVFLVGLARGLFPRPIREDPLLPDRVRQRLREALPDLPVKREGFDEERFLFAQRLASSAKVTLSFSEWDAEGRPLAPSPLLDPLTRGPSALPVLAAPAPAFASPRERACEAGLRASREDFGAALEIALEGSGAGRTSGIAAASLSRARVAVLKELDPGDGRRREAGPYLGFVGRARTLDPRAGAIAVTHLESLARCGWQAFLNRLLGLAPAADAQGALPQGNDARLLGNVVHKALEGVGAELGKDVPLDALGRQPASLLAWPTSLDGILLDAAREVVREEAIGLASYAHALARHARDFVLEAMRADWSAGEPAVLGVEVRGVFQAALAGRAPREISFKADRVDRCGDGGLILTDYKSGAPPADSADPAKHADALRKRIAQGIALQASVYAAAAGERGVGRYLYLRPELSPAVRELVAPADDRHRERLDAALATLLDAWDAGAFVPRVRDPDQDQEPYACQICDLKEACSRGDSGVRLRLGDWAERAPESDVERAAQALWRLPEASA